jgi:hypothetical protein
MEALSDLSDNQIEAIGLSEEVETINFTSIENNKKEFMTLVEINLKMYFQTILILLLKICR